jgi:uncharacterized protein YdaU (DUF1376 family)
MKPPAFQFYVKDFLSSPNIRTMTLAAEGAYIHLLATAWDSDPPGTLPADLDKLRLLARASEEEWKTIWPQIESQFPKRRGRRENDRLRMELRSQLARSKSLSRRGIDGAKTRWVNDLHATAIPRLMPKNSSASAFASASASAKSNTTLPNPPGDREGTGPNLDLSKCQAMYLQAAGETIEILKPKGRRLWTEREKNNLVGGMSRDYIAFFERKGFQARVMVRQ